MKRVLIFVVAGALAAGALAADFVREGFEGSTFPPARWYVVLDGSRPGSWRREAGGPWGAYALGNAFSTRYEEGSSAVLSTYFWLPARTVIHYGFYYRAQAEGNYGVNFRINYLVPPAGYLVPPIPLENTNWKYLSGVAFNPSAALVQPYWSVSTGPGYETSSVVLGIDRVTITDEDPYAVAPTSFGRVKALFR